jgi:hypothetical protein
MEDEAKKETDTLSILRTVTLVLYLGPRRTFGSKSTFLNEHFLV